MEPRSPRVVMQTRVESEEEGSRLSRRSLQCAPESASQTPPPWASSSRTSGGLQGGVRYKNEFDIRRKLVYGGNVCVLIEKVRVVYTVE